MTELLLVRHGQSTWNAAGRVQGQTMTPELTELGRRQAVSVAERLLDRRPRRLLTSDLVRAQQSARIIADVLGLEPEDVPLLRERHYGTLQGGRLTDAVRVARSLADHEPLPGGESLVDVRHRWQRVLTVLRGSPGPVVLVTHGNVIAEAAGAADPGNGSIVPFLLA